jgi:hypothetical protein
MNSKAFQFNYKDLVMVGKNALLVGFAALLTYLAENLGKLDLGTAGVLLVPVVSVCLDSLIKWVKDNTQTKKVDNV